MSDSRSPRLLALALLLAISGLVAPPAHAQNKDKWGVNDSSSFSPGDVTQPQFGLTTYQRAAEAGIGWDRYALYWNNLNPANGSYDFSSSDYGIDNLLNAGLQVYANIGAAPTWAVQGTPGYIPWNCGVSEFIPTNSGCDPRHPDVNAFMTFVSQAVTHYGDRVRYWGFWNEPNYLVFWHSNYDVNQQPPPYSGPDDNLRDLVKYIVIPGAVAARAANPKVQIVGPEIDDPHGLEILFQEEQSYLNSPCVPGDLECPHRPFFDVISFHQYPPKDANGNVDISQEWGLLDRYLPIVQQYGAGRPVWVTESDAPPETVAQLFQGLDQRGWIQRFFYSDLKSYHCLDSNENQDACVHWYALGSTGDALLDRLDVRLPAFYNVQSVIAPRIFTSQTPTSFPNAAPGYEVATQFSSAVNGTVTALRFYRAQGETGTNTLHLWTDAGQPLAAATYTGTATNAWVEVPIGGVTLTPGARYRVSVNTNSAQSKTDCGLGTPITNGPLTAYQGFWGQPMGSMPLNASCSNFFVDVAFAPGAPIFTSQTPASFLSAAPGYEVATQFSSAVSGTIKALRFYRAPGETGDNILHLWTDSGAPLATARFVDNGSHPSGWQEVSVGGVPITANTLYRVSVNTNTAQSKTNCGLSAPITNGPLTAYQGFWSATLGSMPTNGSCSNYFVDAVLDW